MLENHTIKAILEALLFVSDKPITLRQMTAKMRTVIRREKAVDPDGVDNQPASESEDTLDQLLAKQKELEDDVTTEQIKQLLFAIEEDLNRSDRGLELVQVAKGYQLRTKCDISDYIKDDKRPAPSRLSPSSLETLAIVAYEQPVNRNRVEDIRGVDCGGVLKTLLDKDLVRIVGRSDEPGRPLVYGTTNKFLEIFGLPSLKDLPSPEEFQELSFSEESNIEVTASDDAGDGNEYVHAGDFGDEDTLSLSESERAILDELDESLSGLKEVEKGIELFQKPKEEVPAETPLPTSETTN